LLAVVRSMTEGSMGTTEAFEETLGFHFARFYADRMGAAQAAKTN
jgi:hypothetical protein